MVGETPHQVRDRAEALFNRKEQRLRDGQEAMAEYQAELRAMREKTARLRALRLARDADQQAPPEKKGTAWRRKRAGLIRHPARVD